MPGLGGDKGPQTSPSLTRSTMAFQQLDPGNVTVKHQLPSLPWFFVVVVQPGSQKAQG